MKTPSRSTTARSSGFTLIELLIVVAVIAILAAIAVPNYLTAQVRSKVSRVKADMRSEGTALESYQIDNGDWPPGLTEYRPELPIGDAWMLLHRLTSPVAYIESLPEDPFYSTVGIVDPYPDGVSRHFYWTMRDWDNAWTGERQDDSAWSLRSWGPDGIPAPAILWRSYDPARHYDVTNGARSAGDIAFYEGYGFTPPTMRNMGGGLR